MLPYLALNPKKNMDEERVEERMVNSLVLDEEAVRFNSIEKLSKNSNEILKDQFQITNILSFIYRFTSIRRILLFVGSLLSVGLSIPYTIHTFVKIRFYSLMNVFRRTCI